MTALRKALGRIRGSGDLSVLAIFITTAAIFYVLPTLNDKTVEFESLYPALQTFATYGLLALALGICLIAAQFDLSVLGMFALGGMLAVKTGTSAPLVGVLVAAGVGLAVGVVQGSIVARLRLNAMSVTLAGYLVMLGATEAIGHDESVSFANFNVGIKLDQPIAEIFSWHSLIVVIIFAIVGLVLRYSRIGRDIRAVGGGERASRVAGVRVDWVLVGVFAASGCLAGIAGALNSYSLASAQPNPGYAPLVFGATAALLGGVAFNGGRGNVVGIALGAISLSLLQAMFGILASPEWVSSAVTGALLVIAAVSAATGLRERVVQLKARRRSRLIEQAAKR